MAKYISSLITYKIGFRKLNFVDDKFSIKIFCSPFILIVIKKQNAILLNVENGLIKKIMSFSEYSTLPK